MAAVPRLWESAVKVLEDLSDSGSGDAGCSTSTHTGQVEAPLAEAWRRIQRAHEGRVLPEATWKAMIRDKVPYRLAAACQKVLRNKQLASLVPASSQYPYTVTTYGQYAIKLLLQLVSQAASDNVLCSPSGPLKFGTSLGQQLQESGFLDVLPQVLTAAADSLQRIAAALRGEVHQHDAGNSGGRDQGPAGTCGTSTAAESHKAGGSSVPGGSRAHSVNARPHLTAASLQDDSILLQQWKQEANAAVLMLQIPVCIEYCWPRSVLVRHIAPACSAPTVRLALVLLQHVSQLLSSTDELEAASYSSLECYGDVWQAAAQAAVLILTNLDADSFAEEQSLAATVTNRLPLHLEALVSSPQFLPCLCLTMVISTYSALLLQLPALPLASEGASSSSNSTLGPCIGYSASTVDCSPASSSRSSAGGSSRSSAGNSNKKKNKISNQSSKSSSVSKHAAPPAMASAISNPMQAWQFACSQHQLLPASHNKLLHLLGISSRVLLWGAAATAGQLSKKTPKAGNTAVLAQLKDAASTLAVWHGLHLNQCVALYRHLVMRHISSVGMEGLLGLQQCLDQPAGSLAVAVTEQDRRWPFEQQLHYLIPNVLLYWAVNQPTIVPNSPMPMDRAEVLWLCHRFWSSPCGARQEA